MSSYLPVLKVILPYLAPLITSAAPIFTRSSSNSSSEQPSTAQLINELQDAVKNNADALKVIATQLQTSIEAFDERELGDERRFSEILALIEGRSLESASMKSAVDAAVKDIQTTKVISLISLGLALIAITFLLFK